MIRNILHVGWLVVELAVLNKLNKVILAVLFFWDPPSLALNATLNLLLVQHEENMHDKVV